MTLNCLKTFLGMLWTTMEPLLKVENMNGKDFGMSLKILMEKI
jgi:hypothetical protein